MKKLQIWWPVLFAVTLIVGMWIGYKLNDNIPDGQGFFSGSRKASVQEVVDLLERKYVDSVHTDSLTDDAIASMLKRLDPHTIYIPAALTVEANEDLQGNYEGIGVEYFIINDTVNAVNIRKEGPSDKAGLKVGDKFIKVGDSVIAGNNINADRIKKLLRGESGTQVQVTVLRNGKPLPFTITRGTIPKFAIDAAYMMDKETGFIHLNVFSRSAYEEFMVAIERLNKEGMKKLIFDLRGNGGGILEEAVDIADEFLDSSRMVVYTEGLHAPRQEYKCKRPGQFEKGQLILLIDEFTASASEVLAGALQDWDRATIIGRRSFGKGLVQEPFQLSNGAQLRLTVSKYYTPAGRNIQKPFDGNRQHYNEEVYDRFHNGSSINGDSTPHNGKTYRTLVKKRPVFGGGGITPDVFMPFDTSKLSKPLYGLFNNQTFSRFVYNYYLGHLTELSQFKNATEFEASYKIPSATWQSLSDYAKKDSIDLSKSLAAEQQEIERRFRSNLALQIWQTEGFYRVNNQYDPLVRKAVELLK